MRRLVAGLSPLPVWTDLFMAPDQDGLTVLVDPVKGLDVADPDGVLQLKTAARRMQLEATKTGFAWWSLGVRARASGPAVTRKSDVAMRSKLHVNQPMQLRHNPRAICMFLLHR